MKILNIKSLSAILLAAVMMFSRVPVNAEIIQSAENIDVGINDIIHSTSLTNSRNYIAQSNINSYSNENLLNVQSAIQAYNNFLETETLTFYSSDKERIFNIDASNCWFSIIYVDDDVIPELVIKSYETDHLTGHFNLFTYKNEKIKFVNNTHDDFTYIEKTGIYSWNYAGMGTSTYGYYKMNEDEYSFCAKGGLYNSDTDYFDWRYFDANNKEISESDFFNILYEVSNGNSEIRPTYYENTKENRNKYLMENKEVNSGTVDYKTDIASFIANQGMYTIRYLCTDSNFINSRYVYENDGTFASNVAMIASDVLYRGMDGWKDLFTAETSKEEAEKILAALLQEYQSDVEELAMAKNAKKYAGYFVSGLKDYIKSDAIINSVGNQDIEKLSSIITEQKVEELLVKGEYEKLSTEFQKLGGYSENSEIVKTLENYMSSKNLADTLSDGLSFLGDGLEILSITQDTINYLYQLESLLDADEMYSEMLLYLKDNCAYAVVRDAAEDLYRVIYGTYMEQLGYVTTALQNAAVDKGFDLVVDAAVAALPYGKIIKAGFDWGVNISNLIFHIGDTQKLKDNMRTIAYIGNCLKQWTIDNQRDFLMATTDSEKEMYARKLYYSLYMLWNTRKAGEETLQSMFTASYDKWSKYYTMSLQVSSALDYYKNTFFTDEMKEALISVTVSCPVDVEIYDAGGRLVLTARDGEESSGRVDDVYYYVKYQKLDDDYIKILCFPENSGYTVKAIGKALGTVDFAITSITEEGVANRRYCEGIAVEDNTVITVDSVSADSAGYTVTNPVTGETLPGSFQSEPESFVSVTGIILSDSVLEMKTGSRKLIAATITPDNATEKKVIWDSSDKSVATVNSDGVVTAIAEGSTTISCMSLDDMDKIVSCKVNVIADIGEEPACTEHHWDNGVIEKAATCTEQGTKIYTCTICGQTKTEAIAVTGHHYETITTKATTAKNGSITEKCTVCGNVKSSAAISSAKTVTLKATSYTYNGKAKKPSVTIKDSSGKVISSSNYTVAYKNNTKVGKATATIKLKGNYTGTITKTFKILPKGTSVSGKITPKSKGFTVKWKKQSKSATGYQIQYSTSKKFTKKTTATKTVKKASTTKLTVKKLKAKKKYYVRIRTYKTVKGKKYYSAWSKSKSVTTKS